MKTQHQSWWIWAITAGDAGLVGALWPDLRALRAEVGDLERWTATAGVDAVAATVVSGALWLAAAWTAAGLIATLAGALPNGVGRLADRIGRMLLPAVVYRTVAGAAGLGVLLAPAAAGAFGTSGGGAKPGGGSATTSAAAWPQHAVVQETVPGTPPPRATSADAVRRATAAAVPSMSAPLPAPGWPQDTELPAPSWPTADPASPVPVSLSTPPAAAPPVTGPPSAAPPVARPPAAAQPVAGPPPAARPGDAVVVVPGDSLWLLAATRLGPAAPAAAVAESWPQWYRANRAVIGADPDLLRPGQVLRVPADPSATPSP